jgi:hypothetical protein
MGVYPGVSQNNHKDNVQDDVQRKLEYGEMPKRKCLCLMFLFRDLSTPSLITFI